MQKMWAWLNTKLGVDAGHDYVYRRLMQAESRLAYIEAWIANLDAEVQRLSDDLGPHTSPALVPAALTNDPKAHAKAIAERIMAAKQKFPSSVEALKR